MLMMMMLMVIMVVGIMNDDDDDCYDEYDFVGDDDDMYPNQQPSTPNTPEILDTLASIAAQVSINPKQPPQPVYRYQSINQGQGTCLSHLHPISFLLFLTEQVSGESGSRVRQVRKFVLSLKLCNLHAYNEQRDKAGSAKEGPTTG